MKSNVSDYLELAQCVYIDACAKCSADVSDLRDLRTIRSRVEHEGLSFITITLPSFGRDFERSVAAGYIDPTAFRNFRKAGAIPAFLQGMLGLLFDRETGRFYDNEETNLNSPDFPTIIECVRQICLLFKKLEVPCAPERVHAAMENFVAIEQSFEAFTLSNDDRDYFSHVSRVLWGGIIGSFELSSIRPKHGPGATAERLSGNQKWNWQYWYDRLEPYLHLIGDGYSLSTPHDSDELKHVSVILPDQEIPVRVVPVPKTLKGPRIIAIEPCCMQYAQQGVRSLVYKGIETSWLTAGHVNFTDQSVNQNLAIMSSMTGRLATVDLSDASDRVPLDLALEMFSAYPDFRDFVEACRSRYAKLPDGRLIGPLRKFASMGSALCFPVEAMYFYTICVMALLEIQNLPVTLRNVYHVSRELYIYGDDIIVPTMYAEFVLDYLQKYNCKVNTSKTFLTGKFRESCGVDAWNGRVVTPTYLNSRPPKDKRDAKELISWAATANLFYSKGYWRSASFMFSKLERILGPLPYLSETTPGIGRNSFLGYRSIERWNRDLHRFEVKAWVPSPVFRKEELANYAALSASLSSLEGLRSSSNPDFLSRSADIKNYQRLIERDSQHLSRFALHGAVTLKRRWVPAH